MGTYKDSETTKKTIIHVAGQLFAQQGFKHVTVRDIIDAAEANLGALNYHFGTKSGLFGEVLAEACRVDKIDQYLVSGMSAMEQLIHVIQHALTSHCQDIDKNWHYKLIQRECQFPSHLFDDMVEQHFKAQSTTVTRIVAAIVSKPASAPEVEFGVATMVGLLDAFGLYDHLIAKVMPDLSPYVEDKAILASRIADLVIVSASSQMEHKKAC